MNPEAVVGLSKALSDPIHTPRQNWSRRCPDCGRWFTGYPSKVAVLDRLTRHRLQDHQ